MLCGKHTIFLQKVEQNLRESRQKLRESLPPAPCRQKNTAPGLVTQGGPFELQMLYSVAVSSSRRTIAPSAEQSAVQCWPTQAVPDAI